MDINKMLKGVDCTCGKHHSCDIEYVYIESGAISHLGELCKDYKSIMLVADENTFAAAGKQSVEAIGDKKIRAKITFGPEILIPDEEAIECVSDSLEGIDLIVGIGSGVIQDLCKYVAHKSKLPYMIVATAPSMDGYASTGAAMILKGMKETVPATLPKAIIADTGVLKNAPMHMIKAGYGDIIGKFSALCDWKLSQAVNGEYFCQYIYDTTYAMIKKTLSTAKGLLERKEESIKALCEALITVGIMMSFATTSRPASGSEHHLSHFFEITGILNGEPYLAHGIDVAYSTFITAQIREKILNGKFPKKQFCLKRKAYEEKMAELYTKISDSCIALQDKVGSYKKDRVSIYIEKEEEIRKILSEMPSAEEIKKMLAYAKLDMRSFYTVYTEEKIKNAVCYAKDLKDRYTVLWMNYDLFGVSK